MRPPLRSPLRRPLICVLLLALLVYGPSSVLTRLVGPAHWHAASGPGALSAWLHEAGHLLHGVMAWRDDLHARLLPEVHAHRHEHAGLQRHHHAADDPSVVVLDAPDGPGDVESLASAAGTLLMLGPLPRWPGTICAATRAAVWPRSGAARWVDAHRRLPERPPRA